jgi:hypothetical protein
MSAMSTGQDRGSGRYEIRVKGHLESRWAAWFDGMTLTNESDGTTSIHGPVIDQAALHGVLHRLRDTGLPLISVTQLDRDQPHPSNDRTPPTPQRDTT